MNLAKSMCILLLTFAILITACAKVTNEPLLTEGTDELLKTPIATLTEPPPDPCQGWQEEKGLIVIIASEGTDSEDDIEEISALLADGNICPIVTIEGGKALRVSPNGRWLLWFEGGNFQIYDTSSGETSAVSLIGGPMNNGWSLAFNSAETKVAISQIDWSTEPGETMATPKGAWRLIIVDLESGEQEVILRAPPNLFRFWGRDFWAKSMNRHFFTIVGWSQATDELILDLKQSVPFAEPAPESVWAIKTDGSRVRQLVEGPLEVGTSYWGRPALSPDGLYVSYFRGNSEYWSLYTVDLVSGEFWSTALPRNIAGFEHYSLTWLFDNERLSYLVRIRDDAGETVLQTLVSDSHGGRKQWLAFEGSSMMSWCSEAMAVYKIEDEIHYRDFDSLRVNVLAEISNSRIVRCWVVK